MFKGTSSLTLPSYLSKLSQVRASHDSPAIKWLRVRGGLYYCIKRAIVELHKRAIVKLHFKSGALISILCQRDCISLILCHTWIMGRFIIITISKIWLSRQMKVKIKHFCKYIMNLRFLRWFSSCTYLVIFPVIFPHGMPKRFLPEQFMDLSEQLQSLQ